MSQVPCVEKNSCIVITQERGENPDKYVEKSELVQAVKRLAAAGPQTGGASTAGAAPAYPAPLGYAFDPSSGYFHNPEVGSRQHCSMRLNTGTDFTLYAAPLLSRMCACVQQMTCMAEVHAHLLHAALWFCICPLLFSGVNPLRVLTCHAERNVLRRSVRLLLQFRTVVHLGPFNREFYTHAGVTMLHA